MSLRRITQRQAKKLFADGEMIVLCPCKCHPYPPFSMGVQINSKEYLERAEDYRGNGKLWKGDIESTAWSLMYNNWRYYNASYETGYYAHYYISE